MNLRIIKSVLFCFALLICLVIQGCGVYSLSGTSLDYNTTKTITINMFFNETGQGPPSITQNFTERLRDFFLQNTQLTLAPANGDLMLEGTISGYDFRPVTPTASGNENIPDVAAQQRLTVTVSATYINTVDDSFNFENKRFSHYYDYDPDQGDITTIEDQALEEIFQVIIFEIFNATVANW